MPGFRPATLADAAALRDLERAANLVALAHVFPAADFPFPDDGVLERWRSTLADPTVQVDVLDEPDGVGLRAFAAWDVTTLRHLAVHPDAWGTGLARAAVERAATSIASGGRSEALLWCLVANAQARGLYRHLGWRPTGRRRAAEWPPHPVEMELAVPLIPARAEKVRRVGIAEVATEPPPTI